MFRRKARIVAPPAPPSALEPPEEVVLLCTGICILMFYFLSKRWRTAASASQKDGVSSFSTSGETDFDRAAANVSRMRNSLGMKERLRLYSYYKQAMCGDAPSADTLSPWASVVDRTKHASWTRRKGMAQALARDKYVAIVAEMLGTTSGSGDATNRAAAAAAAGAAAADARAVGGGSPIAYTAQGAAGAEASEVHAVSASPQSTSASARAEAGSSSSSSSAVEAALRARIVELEEEVRRLSRPPTKGWLNKYQPQAASWLGSSMGSANSKWEGRFFVLGVDGSGKAELRSYRAEGDAQPTRRIPLANCVVVDEGVKRTRLRGAYRIFSLWALGTLESERGPSSGSLLRVSCNSPQEVAEWFEALVAATGHPVQSAVGSPTSSPAIPVRRAANEGGGPPEKEPLAAAPSASTSGANGFVNTSSLQSGGTVEMAAASAVEMARAVASCAGGATTPPGGSGGLTIVPPPSQYGAAGGGGGGGAEEGSSTPSAPKSSGRRHRKPIDPNLFTASRPMHRAAKASLLSGLGTRASGGGEGGAGGSGHGAGGGDKPANMSGFINLVFLLFVLTNGVGVLENAVLHGLLIPLPPKPDEITSQLIGAAAEAADGSVAALLRDLVVGVLETALVLCLPVLAAYLIERAAVRGSLGPLDERRVGLIYRSVGVGSLHIVNCSLTLVAPCALVWCQRNLGGSGGGVLLLIASVTLFLKLTSWAHVHHDLRLADRESQSLDADDYDGRLAKFASNVDDAEHVHYPNNVTLPNLLYFIVAPTLCYQTAFPRSPRVRPGYLLSLSLRLLVLGTLLPAAVVQFMVPLLEEASRCIAAGEMAGTADRMLKLALPVTYVWVLGFYTFFHVWLNLLAELLRFGDRTFCEATRPHPLPTPLPWPWTPSPLLPSALFTAEKRSAPLHSRPQTRIGGTRRTSRRTGAHGTCRCTAGSCATRTSH